MEYALRKAETDVRTILSDIVNQIPAIKIGQERLEFIQTMLLDLSENVREFIKDELDRFLYLMQVKQASDIDIGGAGCKGKIWYRVFGDKKPDLELGSYSLDEMDILILNILTKKDQGSLFANRFVDFSYTILMNNVRLRFRATAYFELNHLSINMRLIPIEIRSLKSLGFHPEVLKLLSLKFVDRGLVLITGITGSGKSATLDAIIDANNRLADAHIVIISNPVEYVHDSIRSIVRHREIGRDVLSFKEGTIQALRQDPDIIVLGEVRDPETIATVLEVADSGHKVFTTLHTSSATESIDRILGETPPLEQARIRERLADVLVCVISQKLVPSLDGKLILAKEVLVATPAVRTAIRNNNTDEIYQLIYQSGHIGMITMEQDLVNLHRGEKISYQEAYGHANNKKRFEDLVRYYKP
ncbi:Flp pilus assembly complex ATPase component TadA [candidate division KSB1 bacterium]|nr:Flp pilus assembly complex ATPase component TadA [candidate division KSB1 bacterium]